MLRRPRSVAMDSPNIGNPVKGVTEMALTVARNAQIARTGREWPPQARSRPELGAAFSGQVSSAVTPFALSVVMPAHNEARTIERSVRAILDLDVPYRLELVVVDDGSTDQTPAILKGMLDDRVVVHRHAAKLGKGAAVMSGGALVTGTHVVIFDADAEYQASDLPRMAEPILAGRACVVFGTRMLGVNTVYQSMHHALANKAATLAANVLFDSWLSDMHTCLKMMPVPVFRALQLTSRGFGLDSEITGELLRRGYRPYEVPVSYVSRSRAEGKKLTWRDGVDCLGILLRVRLRGSIPAPHGYELTEEVVDVTAAGETLEIVSGVSGVSGLNGMSGVLEDAPFILRARYLRERVAASMAGGKMDRSEE